jgi:Amt family ammonium transporter
LAGNVGQLAIQAYSVLVVLVYSGTATFLLLKLIALVVPLRNTGRVEGVGMDVTEHGEEAYTTGDGAILVTPGETTLGRRSNPVIASSGGTL